MKIVLYKNTFVHTQSLMIYIHTFKIKICIPCPTCSSDRILIFIQLHHFVGAIFRNGFLYKFELTMYHKKPKKQLLQEACLTEKNCTHTIISVSKAHHKNCIPNKHRNKIWFPVDFSTQDEGKWTRGDWLLNIWSSFHSGSSIILWTVVDPLDSLPYTFS